MECAVDIQYYNSLIQEDRVYVFLDGLDDRLDNIQGDVLQMRPFPTLEQTYMHVCREALHQAVMVTGSTDPIHGAVLAAKGLKLNSPIHGPSPQGGGRSSKNTQSPQQSEGAKCTHCGNSKHTRESCFKLHGYPDWWEEFQEKKRRDAAGSDDVKGKAAVVTAEPHLSLTSPSPTPQDFSANANPGNLGHALCISPSGTNSGSWLLDSGATDHMTFTAKYFSFTSPPRRTSITNANGMVSPITGAGTVTLSPSLQLSHTLLVPSLSHKLLSVSQVTIEWNCVVLMYPNFCFLQDILTKEIIRRGTKRGGVYYIDDFSIGQVHHVHQSGGIHERQLWLWHRRLGHPSFGYMKYLFPTLCSKLPNVDFKCETYILAKSHHATYSLSSNKNEIPFSLIHLDV